MKTKHLKQVLKHYKLILNIRKITHPELQNNIQSDIKNLKKAKKELNKIKKKKQNNHPDSYQDLEIIIQKITTPYH